MKTIQSTMAGTVLQVTVSQGDEISAGQTVVLLESMKMEIPLEAEGAGTVQEVKVQVGDFVNEGDTVIELA